jgi:hypothetical protein
MKKLAYLIFTCYAAIVSTVQATDCNELIRLGLYNVRNTVDQHDSLVSAYNHLCNQSYNSSSSSRQGAMNFSFNFLKVGLGLGGSSGSSLSQESWTSICTDTATQNKLYTYNSLNSQTIYDGSLNAWQNCVNLQARGLKTDIRPTSTFSGVSFDLYWTGSAPAKFRGIEQPDLGKANCTVTAILPVNGVNTTVTQVVKANTQLNLTTKAANFVCNRLMATAADGTKSSEATRLTIKTSDGSFDIDLPPLGLRRVSIPEINGLHDKITALESRIATAETNNGTQTQQLASLTTATEWIFAPTCPAGWTSGGAIGFISSMAQAQNVGIGIGSNFIPGQWWWAHPTLCRRPAQ